MRASQLFENEFILYHGDHFGTTEITAKWMMYDKSNNQEGIGIYFSPDIEVAKTYGPKISAIDASELTIVPSRKIAADVVDFNEAVDLVAKLNQMSEDFWYIYSDYGIEVANPEDVETYHHADLCRHMLNEEVRNWQIELAQAADSIEIFVQAWAMTMSIDGLFDEVQKFYSIIQTDIPVTPINF